MAKYFGCDVDLTVVQSDTRWFDWLYERSTEKDKDDYKYLFETLPFRPYNLAELFPSVENPMDYWNELDYSQFEPIEGSVEALERISRYFDIVFISHIEGSNVHGKTKAAWLKKHYPFLKGISYTREKFIHNDSVVGMADDRLSHLKGFEITKRYLFNTKYAQEESVKNVPVMETIYDWKDVDQYFVNDLIKMWR